MAFTKLHPSEAKPSGTSAPQGKMRGTTPPQKGHPVKGKGVSGPKGFMGGFSTKSGGNKTGGHGTKNSRGGLSKGSVSSTPKVSQQNIQKGIYK